MTPPTGMHPDDVDEPCECSREEADDAFAAGARFAGLERATQLLERAEAIGTEAAVAEVAAWLGAGATRH